MTFGWGEVTGSKMTMGRNDRKPYGILPISQDIALFCWFRLFARK